MKFIYHLVTIPTPFMNREKLISNMSKTELGKYFKSKKYLKDSLLDSPCLRGSYLKQEDAVNDVLTRGHHLCESYYGWIVVEQSVLNTFDEFDISGKTERWFRWNDSTYSYEETTKPSYINHIVNFAG